MSQKWNLQDIRPSGAQREHIRQMPTGRPQQDIGIRRPAPRPEPTEALDPDLSSIDIIDGNSQKKKRVFISLFIAVLIIGAAFFTNILLGGAEVTVYPKFKDTSIQASFTASKNPTAGELSYELLTLDATGERQVSAKGQETVSERAIGDILIYNTKATTVQRLIKNTRFESPDGLIYRIKESVEVPAVTKDANGGIVPGVVTVEVFADGTGDQYNIGPSRFTVPGLKGTEQFDAIYGESTVGFTGGFEGSKYIIDDTELETAKQALHLELRNSLLERLKNEKPSGFVVYDQAITFTFESLPSTEYGDSLATIKEKAYMNVPIFKQSEFAQYLAKSTVAGYEDEPVELTDPMTLTFEYEEATTTVSDIRGLNELEFMLKGTTQIVWTFDATRLQSDLLNLQKTALPNVLSGYPSIEKANAVVRPFWVQKFPNTPDEIKVIKIIGTQQTESAP